MVLGGMVVVGWLLGIRILTTIIPEYATIKLNTAFCFVLAGLSLYLLRRQPSQPSQIHPMYGRLGQLCAVLVAGVGLLTMGEYSFLLNFGIDEAWLRDTWTDASISSPGRMSIATAFGFFLLGCSLFFLGRKRPDDAIASQILALSGLVAAVFAYFGYVYGVQGLYSLSFYTGMGVHTATVLIILCAATLLARPDQGAISTLTNGQSGGQMARLILPTALTLPFFIGWLQLRGAQAGLYGTEFGFALFATSNVILFLILVWASAKLLNTRTIESVQSAHRYRFLADAMPQIVWTSKPDGNLDYCNERWFNYTGMTIEQTKDGWKHVIHPDDLQNCIERWTRAFKTACDYEVEYRFKRATDGAYRWHLGRAFPMRNEDGEIVQWVGTCTDIDDQKRARSDLENRVAERSVELAGAKEKLQAVLDAATQMAIIAADTKGVITVFNRGAEQMLGYTAEEIVGKESPTLFHLESEIIARGRVLSAELGKPVQGFDVFVEKARNGQHDEREWTYVRKDGQTLTVNLVSTASYDTNGTIVGFLAVATDVTARAQAERAR
jgi:PAS domain S-box-containing protein